MESNLNPNQIDRIDAFEKGSMTPVEVQAFKEDLKKDPALAEHFKYIQFLKTALQQERNERLIDKFKIWDQSNQLPLQNNNARITQFYPRRRWMAIAASLLFLAFVGWWLMSPPQQANHLSLVDQYFTPYPCTTCNRADGVEKGLTLYGLQDYNLAKNFLVNSTNPDAQFYLANTYLALGESQAAISALKEYEGERFSSVLDWYLALSYLQANKTNEAESLLNQLVAAKGDYSSRATEILKALAK